MPDRAHNDKPRRALRALVIAIGAVIVLIQWVITMLKPHGDFSRHWEFGRRFVHGEFLYNGGLDIPYPPSFAILYSPFSLLRLQMAKPIFFLLGFAALIAILWVLDRLTDRSLPVERKHRLWMIAGTLLVTSRFVIRDFDDAGQNLILVGLTWTAIYLWSRGRDIAAGASLGFATAVKCVPALFIIYFAWKRQWKLAGFALLFAALFSLAPAAWQTTTYFRHMRVWTANITRGFFESDPSVGMLGPEQFQNKSLRPVLARYLMRLPAGHPGRFEGGGYVEFFALSPKTAGIIITAILVLILAGVGWLFRGPATRDNPTIPWECATVSLLTLLYSPITWGQHCVAAIPAVYLIVRAFVSGAQKPAWILWLLGTIAFILIFTNRAIVGRGPSQLLESYHLVTFCLIALLIVVLWQRRRFVRAQP